jgi:methylmalonyl-CoA mutase N-terminal domain/subunit
VGKVGVSISSLRDMQTLLDGIPLDKVSISMTINAPAAVLLAMVIAVGKQQGVPASQLRGTVQNDILKEYIARGTYIFPPSAVDAADHRHLRYCAREVPKWNTISISGYHIREAGSTAVQEVAFTLANGIAYVQRPSTPGWTWTLRRPVELLLQRAQQFPGRGRQVPRRAPLWAKIMRERFGAKKEAAQLAAALPHADRRQHPHRAAAGQQHRARDDAGAGAVLGGTQSLHTNSKDEALALPTQNRWRSRCAPSRSSPTRAAWPTRWTRWRGSFYVEALTDEIERMAGPTSPRSTRWAARCRQPRDSGRRLSHPARH